jgi:hypothetical protein
MKKTEVTVSWTHGPVTAITTRAGDWSVKYEEKKYGFGAT